MGILKKIRKKWKKRRHIDRLGDLSDNFATLEKLVKSGLLHWNEKHRRLFIADSLATLMLAYGKQGWANFMNNIFLFVSYNFLAEKWESKFSVLCAKELAKAKKITPELTIAEIQRIRMSVGGKMTDSAVQLPKLDPFEFYIVRADNPEDIQQCGVYDPDTDRFDIVNWDEVSGTALSH